MHICGLDAQCSQTNWNIAAWRREKFMAGPSKKNKWLMLKKPKLPDDFQGSVLKTVRECGGGEVTECVVHSYTVLWWVDSEVIGWSFKNLNHQSLVSTSLGSTCWWSAYSQCLHYVGGFRVCKTKIWFRILSIACKEELKELDFVLWLNYHYVVLLDCFPLFL